MGDIKYIRKTRYKGTNVYNFFKTLPSPIVFNKHGILKSLMNGIHYKI